MSIFEKKLTNLFKIQFYDNYDNLIYSEWIYNIANSSGDDENFVLGLLGLEELMFLFDKNFNIIANNNNIQF